MSYKSDHSTLSPQGKLAFLNELGRLVLSSSDPDSLFREAAQVLHAQLGLQHVMVGTFDLSRNSIDIRATAGLEPTLAARQTSQGLGQGIIGEVWKTGKTMVFNDVSREPQYLAGIPSTQSELCVPLKVLNSTVGFLNIESDRVGAFEQADIELLEAVGSFLGQAIRNANLRLELEDSRNYLEAVLQNAGDAIVAFDLEGHVRTWNGAAECLVGPRPASVMSGDLLDLFPGAREPLQDVYEQVLTGKVVQGLQLQSRPVAGGAPRTLELTMAPISGYREPVGGVSCILRDITAKILAERELRQHIEAMQLLNQVSVEITSILELEELLGNIAALMRRVIEYEILSIFLYRPEQQQLELKVAIGYAQETIERWRHIPLGAGLLGQAVRERKTLISTDLANDPRAISAKTVDGRWTQSEVAIPIISRGRLLGGLAVESCDPEYFKDRHVRILETLASQIAVSVDNARLFQQLQVKEHKLAMDFALARDLQHSMLAVTMPTLPGWDIASIYKPAESLGGDYYDFIQLDRYSLGVAIGDVSGKGVAAAITMAAVRSALRFAARLNSSPSQVLYHVNRRLHRDVKKRTYVSLFYALLDVGSFSCRWSNGGHFPPILMRADGSHEELAKGGTLVALFDKSRYGSAQTQLKPGDLMCFYTDGVIEAGSRAQEEFGKGRLVRLLSNHRKLSAREILKSLMSDLKRHSRGMEQQDDITAFIIKVREDAQCAEE